MKKKKLSPAKLFLNKITISPLNDGDSGKLKGGLTGKASVCNPCIPPTEPEGCSNGCPVSNTICCPKTLEAAQTQCCPTWPPQCDSYVIACLG